MSLKRFERVIAKFNIKDKEKKCFFFKKNFLLTNIKIDIILKMLLLILTNAKKKFFKLEIF